MNPSSQKSGPPLWQRARELYDATFETEETSPAQDALLAQMQDLMKAMLEELRQPPQSLITPASREQFDILVAAGPQGGAQFVDVLQPGDMRLLSPQFLPGQSRPLVVLLLDQKLETDQWLIVPFSPSGQPLRDGEWATQFDEPLLHVLCFWNSLTVQGCVLDDSQRLDALSDPEWHQCRSLHADWIARRAWQASDLQRSGPSLSSSIDDRQDYVEAERELLRSLRKIAAFRPPAPSGSLALLASAAGVWQPHEQNYLLPGFGRRLTLRSIASDLAEVTLVDSGTAQAAALVSPVLITGVGTEYPLQDGVLTTIPVRELSRGFWVSVGGYGWTSLVAA